MLPKKIDISGLIPQDKPMIMLDKLINHNSMSTTSSLTISSDNIFCFDGQFSEVGIIENIAQTAALRSGYEAYTQGKCPSVGFIGSVKKLKIFKQPTINSTIVTKVEVVTELMSAIVVKGEVYEEEKLIAEGGLNIFLQ
ncbi:MAG: hydroxymyristoyl-ACP dehydratase [Bacteroidales bacterium]|nr:hydroxymyristoyl-ACP dehydratase [Lentimicrobiaceae bacterium]MDG1135440.1 hydroxymyristoyl-ACP dehydratase [Bacteroidales bacterium]MDG1902221.1 hydroxymyristoyl-ACP dehydratase [Bacteroidales bacterium]MDG2080183.1 hydroxymyristoyl-ACP dehydratase [Bacteroidales bacterium]|tara:strand:- start:18790 stop:19206 length:417 start_codon:yes stop_codon:yes gene_type:complete